MKRITLLLIVALSLASCGVSQHYFTRQTSISFLDFRPYSSAGFFFSADPYPGAYEPVGQMLIEIIPAKGPQGTEMPSPDELLEIAYNEAKTKGANGVANFSMQIEDSFVTLDEVVSRPQGGKFQDGVYPSSVKSSATIPAKRVKLSGSLIKIQK